jgi:threonyl-tRNA synthetase
MVFSAQMHRMAEKRLKFERLVVDVSLAVKMFEDNQYKSAQVRSTHF